MQEEPVSSVRASPKQQKQNDVTWLQEWAENVQTVNLELQQRKGGNHQEGKWSHWCSQGAEPGPQAAQLRHSLCPQNPLILLMAMRIEQVKAEASKEQAVT